MSSKVFLPCLLGLLLTTVSYAQGDGGQGVASLRPIAAELRSEFGPVRFERQAQHEDRYFVRGTPRTTLRLMPRLYLVQSTPFDENGRERLPPNIPTMFVATSADGSRIYRLAGFDSAEQSFNRLVKHGPVQKVMTNQDAESRGLFCAEIVYGLSPSWWLGGPLRAKLKAAEHFFSKGHEHGLLLAQKWWDSAKGDHDGLEIRTVRSNGTFLVSVPIFWAPVGGNSVLQVKEYRIEVSNEGTCALMSPPEIILE